MEVNDKQGPIVSAGNSMGKVRQPSDVNGDNPAPPRGGISSRGNEMGHIRDTADWHPKQDF